MDAFEEHSVVDRVIPQIAKEITAWLVEVEAQGFRLPYHVVGVGRNGFMIYYRYTQGSEGLDVESLADYGDACGLPLHLLLVDARGKSAEFGLDLQLH